MQASGKQNHGSHSKVDGGSRSFWLTTHRASAAIRLLGEMLTTRRAIPDGFFGTTCQTATKLTDIFRNPRSPYLVGRLRTNNQKSNVPAVIAMTLGRLMLNIWIAAASCWVIGAIYLLYDDLLLRDCTHLANAIDSSLCAINHRDRLMNSTQLQATE